MVSKSETRSRKNSSLQDRVSDEQKEQADAHNSKCTQVDNSSFCEDVAVALVFLPGLWVV